ncbi:MAG TPA: PilZ domain-containing protein [Terriglobales bacterium]|nr:PilZ domain-containing protein [Terriglobales bacterium]
MPLGKGHFVLGVSGERLLLDGVAIDTGQAERGFAQLLTASGLASIQFCKDVTADEFEKLVRAFAFSGGKAQDLADQIRNAFADNKGNIRVNEVKFVAADPATASMTAAAQIAAQSLGPEFKDWLNDPTKLVQVIAAAEGSQAPKSTAPPTEGVGAWTNAPFTLSNNETLQALHLLTRFGELGATSSPKPELIGSELHRAEEKIKDSVLMLLDELSSSGPDSKAAKPILMRAAEQMAIRYALERFESGDLRVNAVHELLGQMSDQMSNLRKILEVQEDKMSRAGMLVDSHADILDRMFWSELPEGSKKRALLSEDAACVPARNIRQYTELLIQRGDRETASAILTNYAAAVASKDPDYRSHVADGIAQLSDLYAAVGGTVLGDAAQKLGDSIAKESNPEIEALLSAAFVRLSSEAAQRKQYRAVAQTCEAIEYVASRRPALERELRSRIGIEGRLPEFIEDALREQQHFNADLVGVLRRNSQAAAEHLAERFFRAMRREDCDRIVELVHELGMGAHQYLCEMLRTGPQRLAVSSVGLMSRLDVASLLEFLPERLPQLHRFYHDLIVRQIAYGAATDRGRTLLEILELLDPVVIPQALDEIGMSGDRSAAPPLIVMAAAGEAEGRPPLLQLKAIEALGRLREPDAVPVLRNLFESKKMFKYQHHRELRIAAAQSLAKIDVAFAAQVMAETSLEPGELAIGPLDSAPACPWVRQRRYERVALKRPITATISSSWGKSTISVHEMSLGGGMGTKEDALRVGSDADLEMNVGMRRIRGQVVLRRAHVNEVGFEFVSIDLESRHRLRKVLISALERGAGLPRSGKSYDRAN